MVKKQQETVLCDICKKKKMMKEVVPAELISQSVAEIILKTNPDWTQSGFVCISDLNRFRTEYVRHVLKNEKGELSELENQVVASLKENEILSENINIEFDKKLTLGERLSDKIAEFGGSWRFIILFGAVLFLWIAINSVVLLLKPFDPYPFILLNLLLSCLAAIQAPIIMMSQNRQEAKDRLRSEHDYRVNLKAELEIRHLHTKIDHLLMNQWQKLLEIQKIQVELIEEVARKTSRGRDL